MTKIKDITPGTNGKDLLSQSASRRSDVNEGNPSTTSIRENNDLSTQNAKKVEKRFSVDLDDISDFDAITFAKWFIVGFEKNDFTLIKKKTLSPQETQASQDRQETKSSTTIIRDKNNLSTSNAKKVEKTAKINEA